MQQMQMQGQMQQMNMSSNSSSPRTGKNTDITLMLRNIPNKYTQEMLLEHLSAYRTFPSRISHAMCINDNKKLCGIRERSQQTNNLWGIRERSQETTRYT